MKYSEIKKVLKKHGCCKQSEGANHEIWYSPINNTIFPVGRHNNKEIPTGTQNAIFKQSGIKI